MHVYFMCLPNKKPNRGIFVELVRQNPISTGDIIHIVDLVVCRVIRTTHIVGRTTIKVGEIEVKEVDSPTLLHVEKV